MEDSDSPSRAQLLLMIKSLERRISQLEGRALDMAAASAGGSSQVAGPSQSSNQDIMVWTVGMASVVLKKDGSIAFDGRDIRLSATGSVTVKASGNLTLQGAKILENQ